MPGPSLTAITRSHRTDGSVVVELVDLAGDDAVLGRVRTTLPPGHGAVVEAAELGGDPAVGHRLYAALADELRALGRRRLTRVLDAVEADAAEPVVLAAHGFVELRRDAGATTHVLEL